MENAIKFETVTGIKRSSLESIISNISDLKITLIGDICLDIYWKADMTKSRISRETPHFSLPIVKEWMLPGAGGNVVANLAALGSDKVYVIGVVGNDWRGGLLLNELRKHKNIDTGGISVCNSRITNAYCKPLRKGLSDIVYEDPRIDFENTSSLSSKDEALIIDNLEYAAKNSDAVCVSDQFMYGCITEKIRGKLIELGRGGHTVIVDSRENIGLFTNVILKPNEHEGIRAVTQMEQNETALSLPSAAPGTREIKQMECYEDISLERKIASAKILAEKNNSLVCMTLGSQGCCYSDGESVKYIPSYTVDPPIDICGAGDTFLSAFASAYASGAKVCEACSFANMAADVTIAKIGTTGTATPGEIIKRYEQIQLNFCTV